jgi:diaminopimelate decarboxylase
MKQASIDFFESLSEKWWQQQSNSLFFYFEELLLESLEQLQNIKASTFKTKTPGSIYYSLKSNPNPQVLLALAHNGLNFDVSSVTEFNALLKLGINPQRISFSGPNKSNTTLQHLVDGHLKVIHLDNKDEWIFIENQIRTNRSDANTPNICLRIPSENTMTHKLGIPIRDLDMILNKARDLNYAFLGFHTYLGRENFSSTTVIHALSTAAKWMMKFPKQFSNPQIFLGVGLPQLDLFSEIIQNECSILHPLIQNSPLTIHLELGRGLVSSCGFYATQVLSVKKDRPEPLIIIDGGLQHLASKFSSPRFGEQGFEALVLRQGRRVAPERETRFVVYGSLGIAHDRLIQLSLPSTIERGDWMIFMPCGAYGFTGATQQFLGLGEISEYFVRRDKQLICTPKVPSYQQSWSLHG